MSRLRPRLSREAVLDAALAVIDRSGLDGCTMRAVAAELGVEAMSLYWHVPGKDALLDGVVERVLDAVAAEHARADGDGWRDGLAGFAAAFRDVVMRHPNVAPLVAARPLGAYAAAARMAERGIAVLEDAGFDRRTAIRATRSVSRYVIGFTLVEARIAPREAPPPTASEAVDELLAQVVADDPGELFRFGLEVMLDGLEARLSRPA